MSLQAITQFIDGLPGISSLESSGYTFYFYGDEQVLPFVTYAASDNEYDNMSRLDREGVYRVNIGVSGNTFDSLFSDPDQAWDYTVLNRFMPHPHYAAQHFICVLNPEGPLLEQTLHLIDEAYAIARGRFDRKQARKGPAEG